MLIMGTMRTVTLPRMCIDIFFSAHATALDMSGIEQLFQRADVYIPEYGGWREQSLLGLRDLTYGRVTPSELFAELGVHKDSPMFEFHNHQAGMLYKSFKPIMLVDVPRGHPSDIGLINHLGLSGGPCQDFSPGPNVHFGKLISTMREHIKEEARLQMIREDYMLSRLAPQLEELLGDHCNLKSKSELRLLMFLGAAHTRVSHELKKFGQSVRQYFPGGWFVYNFRTEAVRRYAACKEVTNELAARVIFEAFVGPSFLYVLHEISKNTKKCIAFIRKVICLFSQAEIRNIFQLCPDDANVAIVASLNRKGCIFPRTEIELDRYISEY